MTKRQKEILNYITEYINENGYSPSLHTVKDAFGLSAHSTAWGHIDNLKDKGYISKDFNRTGTIKVIEPDKKGMLKTYLRGQFELLTDKEIPDGFIEDMVNMIFGLV